MTDEQAPEVTEDEKPAKPARKRSKNKSREDLIREVDPKWQEGQPTKHLQAITGADGSIIRFVKGDEAPGSGDQSSYVRGS